MKIYGDIAPMYSNPFGDPRATIRHQTLIQDFRELNQETQAMRRKLEAVRERKAILMAEVRFLRQRYKHLIENEPVKRVLHESMLPTNSGTRGRSNGPKIKKQSRKPQAQVPRFDLNSKSPKIYTRNEVTAKPLSHPDPNQSERLHNANETEVKKGQRMRLVDLKTSSGRRENNEVVQQIDMKLAACRNSKNGTNRTGKRKISWQDPVALRV